MGVSLVDLQYTSFPEELSTVVTYNVDRSQDLPPAWTSRTASMEVPIMHKDAATRSAGIIGDMRRVVGAQLDVDISAPTTLELQIGLAPHPNTKVFESLSFVLDGNPLNDIAVTAVVDGDLPEDSIDQLVSIR